MRRTSLALAAALSALSLMVPAAAFAGGKEIFTEQKCTKCHSVKAEGIAATDDKGDKIIDLSGAGKERDAKWFPGWLKKETEIDSKVKPGEKVKHKSKFKGSDADLETLSSWLKGLTKK